MAVNKCDNKWSACLPFFWPRWALQCPGAGWEAQTWGCILSSQALGLLPEVLFSIFVLELMGYFYLMRPLGSVSFLSGVGRVCDHRNLAWGLVVVICCLLLPIFSILGYQRCCFPAPRAVLRSPYNVWAVCFSCDLGSIGCAVSKWTAAKWLSDYISGFCS